MGTGMVRGVDMREEGDVGGGGERAALWAPLGRGMGISRGGDA